MTNKPQLLTDWQKSDAVPVSIYCAGGGSQFIADMNKYGGSSQKISQAVYLNATEYTTKLLGYNPRKFVSKQTALDLAMYAYQNQVGTLGHYDVKGFGVTCKLATDGEREGREHIVCIGIQAKNETEYIELKLDAASREEQEDLLAIRLLEYLIEDNDKNIYGELDYDYQQGYVFGQIEHPVGNHRKREDRTVFAGTLNPIHHKHLEMAAWAEKKYSRPVEYLLSMENLGKPWTNHIDTEAKIALIRQKTTSGQTCAKVTVLPSAVYFHQKMENYYNSVFIVGSDNLPRLEQYYFDELVKMMTKNNNRLLIFPRLGHKIGDDWKIFGLADIEWDYVDDGTSSTLIRSKEAAL